MPKGSIKIPLYVSCVSGPFYCGVNVLRRESLVSAFLSLINVICTWIFINSPTSWVRLVVFKGNWSGNSRILMHPVYFGGAFKIVGIDFDISGD